MAEPAPVARLVATMRAATALPVTVKTRIGIDHQDNYDFLARFRGGGRPRLAAAASRSMPVRRGSVGSAPRKTAPSRPWTTPGSRA
ncbi:MAG: tRNA-dihydrouridine synthase [Arhodomonas sp.]|nr:tRNA-dihydrouridine synthase [Arhodomonas sp.]